MLALLVSSCSKTQDDVSLVGMWTLCDDEKTTLEFRNDNTVWWLYHLDSGGYLSITGEYSQKGAHIPISLYGQNLRGDYYGIRSADLDGDVMNVLTYKIVKGHMESHTDTYKKRPKGK